MNPGNSKTAIPKYLYKYQIFKPSYFEDIVLHNKFFCSNGTMLNDPFDCRTALHFKSDQQDRFLFYDKTLEKEKPEMTQADRKEYIENNWKELDPANNPSRARGISEKFEKYTLKKSGVACFSRNKDNILLWSHYADGHKGVCYEFQVKKENIFYNALEVNYSEKRAKVPFFYLEKDLKKYIYATFLTKAKDYTYENEYRVIRYNIGAGYYGFKRNALVSIIFGCLANDKIIEEAKKTLAKTKMNIGIYKAYKDDSQYKLNIKPL